MGRIGTRDAPIIPGNSWKNGTITRANVAKREFVRL
jgi:hypothetical protein